MKLDKSTNILIVGLGLMGGSYAQALSGTGYCVRALEIDAASVAYAKERGWICEGFTGVIPEKLAEADLVIFALYPEIFLKWIEENQQYLKPGTILTDVTGVKGCVVERVQSMLRADLEFIAAHPMAGRESSGIDHADQTIFRSANYIVTPTEKNTPEAIALCKELGRILGFARIVELTVEKHDEMIAYLSQLTHCIAIALMTARDTEHMVAYTGDSFRDLTRIAKINDAMWSRLFLLNKEELLKEMDLFSTQFARLRDMIAEDKEEEMREMMRFSTQQRILFDKPEGGVKK